MAIPTRKNRFEFGGRLLGHPSVFTNKDGSKTVLMHVATDKDWNPQTKQYDFDDIELRVYVPADRVGSHPALWAVKGSSVGGTARWNSYRKSETETTRSMDVFEFELDDTKAETEARLTRYAQNGDQRAAELLAERQGSSVQTQPTQQAPQQAQAPAQNIQAPQQAQAQPAVDNSWATSMSAQMPAFAQGE